LRYTVVWQPSAERELGDIWLKAQDQTKIAAAANRIDRDLQYHPIDVGESRDGNRRVMIVPPLTISYTIYEEDYLVKVTKVRRHSSS
jgi:hypothetical protein